METISNEKMKKVIVLNGIHMSGKSTLGKCLAKRGFSYYPEMAMLLLKMGHTIGLECDDIAFQYEILKHDKIRDKKIIDDNNRVVIESWHTCGLAHAINININEAKKIESEVKKTIAAFAPLFIYLDLDPKKMYQRKSKIYDEITHKHIDFYQNIDKNYKNIYNRLGLNVKYVDATLPVAELHQKVEDIINDYYGY